MEQAHLEGAEDRQADLIEGFPPRVKEQVEEWQHHAMREHLAVCEQRQDPAADDSQRVTLPPVFSWELMARN